MNLSSSHAIIPNKSVTVPTKNTQSTLQDPAINTISHPILLNPDLCLSPSTTPTNSLSLSNNDECGRNNMVPQPDDFTSVIPITPDNLILLHHKDEAHYALEEFCLPVSATYQLPNNLCQFNRNCIINKAKVLTKGRLVTSKSNTVFGSVSWTTEKNNNKLIDTRLIKCVNPTCKYPTTKLPKVFHYGCYMHMIEVQESDQMKHIQVENEEDKLFELVKCSVDVASIHKLIANISTQLLFPFCGKRCFNKLNNHRNKIEKKTETDYSTASSWENDGDSKGKRSSMIILIDWLTTEENCSKYFGGIDANGRTNGNRKEAYHHHIRDMIKKENGKSTMMRTVYKLTHQVYCIVSTHLYINITQ